MCACLSQTLSTILLWTAAVVLTAAAFDCNIRKDGYYPDPSHCAKYYRCVWGKAYHFPCQPGLLFSTTSNTCDWPRNVNCVNGNRPDIDIGTTTTTASTTTTTTTTATAPDSDGNSASSFEVSCQGLEEGTMFRDPLDCSKYYWCVHGEPLHRQCGPPTVFNTLTNTCDWPQNVDCSADTLRPTQRTRATTTTTSTATTTTTTTATTATTTATTTIRTQRPSSSGAVDSGNRPDPEVPISSSGSSGCARRVCYYTNWSQYRPGNGKFVPENVDPSLCTHMIYAFAKLKGNDLAPFEWNDESTPWMKGMYERFNDMKRGTNVKTLLAIGGWNMGSGPFTSMVATQQSRQHFANQSLSFLKSHGFDGLDLDWEYPANRGSPPEDREKFTLLVQQLREVYDRDAAINGGSPLLLTAAVAAGKDKIDTAYDVVEISRHLDFINLMTYDLHGSWEKVTGHQSGLYPYTGETPPESYLNTDWAARYWVSQGCPKNKLVIGIPTYGRTFTLSSTADTGVGAPARGAGSAGRFTREAGFLSYYEVCSMKAAGGVTHWIESQRVPYLVKGDQWVGYENTTSVREKVRYVKENGYGGVMMWALDLDDFTGSNCGQGRYPLWSAVNNECQ